VLFQDPDARRQLANERIADLAQEARRVPASTADTKAANRSRLTVWLLLGREAAARATAFASVRVPRVMRTRSIARA
jgi:hypothetical protein